MHSTLLLSAFLLGTSLLVAMPAFAVNEHHAQSEAADRALILERQEKGLPVYPHELNIPDPKRNTVNGPNSPTPVGLSKTSDEDDHKKGQR